VQGSLTWPREIDAEPVDHVACPAAAVALQFQRLFGGENAAVAPALGVQQKVAFLAEQAKAVPDLPGNLQRRVGLRRASGAGSTASSAAANSAAATISEDEIGSWSAL